MRGRRLRWCRRNPVRHSVRADGLRRRPVRLPPEPGADDGNAIPVALRARGAFGLPGEVGFTGRVCYTRPIRKPARYDGENPGGDA